MKARKIKTVARPTDRVRPRGKRILIVEDHPVFREGLVQSLREETDLVVCGEAGTTAEALRAIAKSKPDLVLVDITLPDRSGLELIRQVRSRNHEVKLLVLSMHDEALYANRVLRLGADGYIMKQEEAQEIVHAIRDVLAGRIYVSEEVLTRRVKPAVKRRGRERGEPLARLTDGELEMLELVGRGLSPSEIAGRLKLGRAAVTARCAQMRRKLRLKSNAALVRYAARVAESGSS